jgi:hypothetical protein
MKSPFSNDRAARFRKVARASATIESFVPFVPETGVGDPADGSGLACDGTVCGPARSEPFRGGTAASAPWTHLVLAVSGLLYCRMHHLLLGRDIAAVLPNGVERERKLVSLAREEAVRSRPTVSQAICLRQQQLGIAPASSRRRMVGSARPVETMHDAGRALTRRQDGARAIGMERGESLIRPAR